jgi:hypothetical protein
LDAARPNPDDLIGQRTRREPRGAGLDFDTVLVE